MIHYYVNSNLLDPEWPWPVQAFGPKMSMYSTQIFSLKTTGLAFREAFRKGWRRCLQHLVRTTFKILSYFYRLLDPSQKDSQLQFSSLQT